MVEKWAELALSVNPDHIIVYGGALPSSMPELLMEKGKCDYILAGECELSLPSFVKSIQNGNFYPRDISGLFFIKNKKIFGNQTPRLVIGERKDGIARISDLSKPDYSLLDMNFYVEYLNETNQSFEVMASQGCKANCSFCRRLVLGIGYKSVDAILDEISDVMNKLGINRFYFVDENFLGSKSFFKELIEKKKERGLDFTFRGQCRADAIDEEICSLGSGNGLFAVSLGIESANQTVLDKIGKGVKIADVEKSISLLQKYNIGVTANFIMGFPEDTEEDYEIMANFIRKNKLEQHGKLGCLTPTPGTRLWKQSIENGFITDEWEFVKKLGNLFFERMVNYTDLSDETLDAHYKKIVNLLQRPVTYPKSERYLKLISVLH